MIGVCVSYFCVYNLKLAADFNPRCLQAFATMSVLLQCGSNVSCGSSLVRHKAYTPFVAIKHSVNRSQAAASAQFSTSSASRRPGTIRTSAQSVSRRAPVSRAHAVACKAAAGEQMTIAITGKHNALDDSARKVGKSAQPVIIVLQHHRLHHRLHLSGPSTQSTCLQATLGRLTPGYHGSTAAC